MSDKPFRYVEDENFNEVERLLRQVHRDIGHFLRDGNDPIDCYMPEIVDPWIKLLIKARTDLASALVAKKYEE